MANHIPPQALVSAQEVGTALRRQQMGEHHAREQAFIAFMGQPGVPKVELPPGHMAVTLSVKFDNSDIQSDYFDSHASLSPDFMVLLVKKQAQTEKLARRALELCTGHPQALPWQWKTEKYSMGHGNYLISSGFELPDELKNLRNHYAGAHTGPSVSCAHFEIEFTSYDKSLWPYKHYGQSLGTAPASGAYERAPREQVSSIKLTENREKAGLELRFPTVPADVIRTELKAAGWRWSRFGGCWYVKDSTESRAWAAAFISRLTVRQEPAAVTLAPVEAPDDLMGSEAAVETHFEQPVEERAPIETVPDNVHPMDSQIGVAHCGRGLAEIFGLDKLPPHLIQIHDDPPGSPTPLNPPEPPAPVFKPAVVPLWRLRTTR